MKLKLYCCCAMFISIEVNCDVQGCITVDIILSKIVTGMKKTWYVDIYLFIKQKLYDNEWSIFSSIPGMAIIVYDNVGENERKHYNYKQIKEVKPRNQYKYSLVLPKFVNTLFNQVFKTPSLSYTCSFVFL